MYFVELAFDVKWYIIAVEFEQLFYFLVLRDIFLEVGFQSHKINYIFDAVGHFLFVMGSNGE